MRCELWTVLLPLVLTQCLSSLKDVPILNGPWMTDKLYYANHGLMTLQPSLTLSRASADAS